MSKEVDYHMLYEEIVVKAWGKIWRSGDPLNLGDTNTMGLLKNDLNDHAGINAKIGLMSALKKIAAENEGADFYEYIMNLYYETFTANEYGDLCNILDQVKEIFNTIGLDIT